MRVQRGVRHMLLGGLLFAALLAAGQARGFLFYSPYSQYSYLPQYSYAPIYLPQTYYKGGVVYARSIVPGPNDQPVYVEFDPETGEDVQGGEIAEAHGDWADLRVLAGSEYRAWFERLDALRETHPNLELVSAEDYRDATYTTVAGVPIGKRDLAWNTRYVALLPAALRYLPKTSSCCLSCLSIPTRY